MVYIFSTFAWYQATATMTAAFQAKDNLTATAAVTTASAMDIYAKFELLPDENDQVQMTSYDGYCYAVDVNSKLRAGTNVALAAGVQYGTATWRVTFWYDSACSSRQVTGEALNDVDAVEDGGISFTVGGDDNSRVRLSLVAPDAKGGSDDQSNTHLFGETFGSVLGNTVTATVGSISNGTVTWSQGGTIYYAIYGGAYSDETLKDKDALDALIGQTAQDDGTGSSAFTQTVTVEHNE